MSANLIVLMTDFGQSDPYVGIMKGVISGIAPHLNLIDLTHQIPPGDIQEGAFHLWQAAVYFPSDTVFLAVVDPGVGTERKGLFFQRENQVFIGPDNGLFSYLAYRGPTTAWELSNPDFQSKNSSNTFHGRDIFAPAAAHAALGTAGDQFGEVVHSLIHLTQPTFEITKDHLKGEVISIDRFGNLITSLGQFLMKDDKLLLSSWITDMRLDLPRNPTINLSQSEEYLPLVATYDEIPPGSCAGLIGSSGLLEISAKQSSAAELLGLRRGDRIALTRN